MTRARHIIEEYDIKKDWQKTKSVSGQALRDVGPAVKQGAQSTGRAIASGASKFSAARHQRKLRNIERKKQLVQAKHNLKLQKKQLKADQKLYKYDPLIH